VRNGEPSLGVSEAPTKRETISSLLPESVVGVRTLLSSSG